MTWKQSLSVTIFVSAVVTAATVLAHSPTEVRQKVMGHLGGTSLWEEARFAHFVFASEREGKLQARREHYWDRYDGRYVLKMEDKEGNALRMFFNVNTQKGVAFKNGVRVEGEAGDELIAKAYGAYVNDAYWIFMPTKLADPGVTLTFLGHGDEDANGRKTELARLTFAEGTGLTPGDVYEITIGDDGGIIKWKYTLEGGGEGEWLFQELKDCGMGLRFHTRKYNVERRVAIVFPVVELSKYMEDAIFVPR